MKRAKYSYAIEAKWQGDWRPIFGEQDGSLEYMRGRMATMREYPGPRSAYRLVRSDGKVLEEVSALTELSYGMLPQGFGYQWSGIAAAAHTALLHAAWDARHRNADASIRLQHLAEQLNALLEAPAQPRTLRGWRWVPGMLARDKDGTRVRLCHREGEAPSLHDEARWAPDLADPATVGCLTVQMRERWGDDAWVQFEDATWTCWVIQDGQALHFDGATEGEAVMAAIEWGVADG